MCISLKKNSIKTVLLPAQCLYTARIFFKTKSNSIGSDNFHCEFYDVNAKLNVKVKCMISLSKKNK